MAADVWHPVSETPPVGGRYFAYVPRYPADPVCTADWHAPAHRWVDECGDDVTRDVTHWAFITYPPAPEVE